MFIKLQHMLAGLLAISGVLPMCSPDQAAYETPVRLVRYMAVEAARAGETRTFSGVAKPGVNSKLSFKVAGTIRELAADTGDRVQAGDLIAELDRTDYALQLQQAEAALANIRAQAEQAEADLTRMIKLLDRGAVAERMHEQAETAAAAVRAGMDAARKQVDLARQQLSYTRLEAPFDGYITWVAAEVNENLGAGHPVAVLSSDESPEVAVNIPESVIAHINAGDAADVHFAAWPDDESVAGAVSEVSLSPAPGTSTFPVRITLPEESKGRIYAGMTAEVTFTIGEAEAGGRFIVPPGAVAEDAAGHRYVYVLENTDSGFGTAQRRNVDTGALTSAGLEIRSGLETGDLIVTAGVARIDDGQRVRISPEEMRACP
jgi:membrane fusion protein, multidrug efflux system